MQIKTQRGCNVIFPSIPVRASPMEWERIRKRPDDVVRANLRNYEDCAGSFSWAQARALLDGLPDGGLNIAHEAIDRHVLAGRGGKLALRWIGRDNAVREFSYADLRAESSRFANVLSQHGIAKGDRAFSLLGRCPELYMAAFGTLRNGSVFSPLFSAFGPEPIKARMSIGAAKVLVTSEAFYRRKVEPWRHELASLELVLLTECSDRPPAGTMSLSAAMAAAPNSFDIVADGCRRHGASALHQRDNGAAERRRARPRGGGGASHDRSSRARSARGRCVLVHRRSRMGHRHVLRHHLAADQRRHDDRRSGGLRRRALVPHSGAAESLGLVYGADRHPDADENRR